MTVFARGLSNVFLKWISQGPTRLATRLVDIGDTRVRDLIAR